MSVLTAKEVAYEYRNSYQTVQAVNGVSCAFEQGRVYAIVGSSGSGKTTFLSLLAGLDVPSSGSIDLDGRSTSEIDRDEYRLNHVSVIYQKFNLFQHLTALENAAYPLYVRKMSGKKADALAQEKLRHHRHPRSRRGRGRRCGAEDEGRKRGSLVSWWVPRKHFPVLFHAHLAGFVQFYAIDPRCQLARKIPLVFRSVTMFMAIGLFRSFGVW